MRNNMINSISVKRIEPGPSQFKSEFNIAINFEETTALLNGYLDILNDMLKERLKIDLRRYNIVSFNKGTQ